MLHLEEIVRRSLDMFSDLVSVRGPMEERPQDEHVECPLQNRSSLGRLFCHSRYPTLDLPTIVDIRLSVVKFQSWKRAAQLLGRKGGEECFASPHRDCILKSP